MHHSRILSIIINLTVWLGVLIINIDNGLGFRIKIQEPLLVFVPLR